MSSSVIFEYPFPEQFSFKECLWFLDRNYDDCMHLLSPDSVTKVIKVKGRPFLIRVSAKNSILEVRLLEGRALEEDRSAIISYVKNWFDLERDLSDFYKLLLKDSQLNYMPGAYYGLRLVSIPDLFEALCWGIIGQQINLNFAYKLKRKLVERYAEPIGFENKFYYSFPSSNALSKASIEDLRAMQFSQKKAEYLIGIATAFEKGEISEVKLRNMASLKDKQAALTSIRGIGLWTANYALMKSFREPSCIPYGDAGLINALLRYEIISRKEEGQNIDALFKPYDGWESYLVFYLWRSLSVNS
jgi:DNA-3-methyladenine glycosylase II